MNNKIKERVKHEESKNMILKILQKEKKGLTIKEISNKLKRPRSTIVLALAELKGQNRLTIREVGNAKLHYLN